MTEVAQLAPIVQRAVTGEVCVAVSSKQQSKTNKCWATTGWVVDLYKGGSYTNEQSFVTAKGYATARTKYEDNKVTDIDRIIGSSATTNRLSAPDSAPPFSKSIILRKLGSKPIVANVNNGHYIVICGKRFKNGAYQLKDMDPGTGTQT